MNPYRHSLSMEESVHIDLDMSSGERITLLVAMLLNVLSMLAFAYLCVFHTSFMLYRFMGIVQ